MGFGISHQSVGINRVGEYLKPCRTKGNPSPGPSPFHGEGRTAAQKVNEPWRRISDLVGANAESHDPKVRKRCVRKLARWIERQWSAEQTRVCARSLKNVELTQPWDWEVSTWRRSAQAGLSVEALCFRLGISERGLTALLRETLNVSAGELLDGFRIRNLRAKLTAQFRAAAERLWDTPGEFAKRRCMEELRISDCGMRNGIGGARNGAARRFDSNVKRSAYFRTQPAEFLGLEHGEEEALRLRELLGMLDRIRDENDFDADAFAAMLGFESSRALRRACVMVFGRTLKQVERIVAREVVSFYLAAEDRELRAVCARDDEFGFRAREIFCGDGERILEEPVCDRWSACEAGKPEWLRRMVAEFGLGG